MIRLLLICSLFSFLQANAQTAQIIKVEDLESLLTADSDKVQVINFWATWCGPCIKELPFIENAGQAMSDNVDVTLITVDFVEDLEKVNKFISRKALQSNVLLIDNVDYNSWIDKVDKSWSGAIPATLILNTKTGQRKFVEHELKEGEIESLIEELL